MRRSTSSTADPAGAVAAELLDLGSIAYREAHARQLQLVGERQRDQRPDVLVLAEHPHVFTLGRRRGALAHVLAPGEVEVVEVERGGDVTYHGPGQVVAYPILRLQPDEQDLHRFLRHLEEAIIRTVARWDLVATREPGRTGVWVGDGSRKIASIGLSCRKWVTFHGLALNVAPDMTYFQRIAPCGFAADVMTSMAREIDADVEVEAVKMALVEELGVALGRSFSVA